MRVKLQDPVGYSSDTLWSSDGLKTRSSLVFSASQALSERPASFTLRAPRLQSEVDSRAVHSAQTTPPSESDGGEEAVDNQKEDEEQNVLSENADELPVSWAVASRKPMSKVDFTTDNQEMESSGLSLNLLQDRENAARNGSHSVDIWTNPQSGFDDNDPTSTGSSSTSPVNQKFSSLSASTARSNSERISIGDGNVADCRVPPGMSLFDRIQEDFPRTPSPEFGHFGDESLPTRRPLFREKENYSRSMHGINKGIGHLKIGNYHSAPLYGSAYDSHYNLNDMSRMAQYTTSYSPGSINCHRHPFGRSSSEPVFGGSFPGVMPQGYPSPNESSANGIYGYPMAGKGRWAASENTYSFPSSPFGFTPSDYASVHPSVVPSYPVSYTDECCGMKPVDKMLKARSSYFVADQTLFERHNFGGYDPRSQMPHRPNAGSFQRDELEFFHPIAHSYSSNTLLEEFNSAPKSEKWGLSVIKGHLFIFAKDQTGSRFIQQKLEKADERAKADAFSEIFPNSLLLMTDVFGNYVIQKFLEYGSLEQQQLLVELMTSNMISLALQVYGCRVIQRALEVTHVEEQLALIRQLKGHVMKCAVDQNGNHVLQKCIEAASWKRAAICNGLVPHRFVKGEDIQFIIDSFVGQAACLSTHSYGCRVIQRVLEHCAPVQIRPLLDEIIYKCRDLVKDQFGNYVVQHVISHGEQNQRDIVMQAILPEIARWSQHKYASNVVESCLDHATKEEISQIVDFILQYDESGASCALLPMMKHMYGNYVVQKLLERVDDHDRHRIVCIIRHNEDYLKRFTFGKHVLSRLEREEQVNNFY